MSGIDIQYTEEQHTHLLLVGGLGYMYNIIARTPDISESVSPPSDSLAVNSEFTSRILPCRGCHDAESGISSRRLQCFNDSEAANPKVAPRQYTSMTITLHALLIHACEVLPRES